MEMLDYSMDELQQLIGLVPDPPSVEERLDELEQAVYDNHEPRMGELEARMTEMGRELSGSGSDGPLEERVLAVLRNSPMPIDKLEVRRGLMNEGASNDDIAASEVNKALYSLRRRGLVEMHDCGCGGRRPNRPRWAIPKA